MGVDEVAPGIVSLRGGLGLGDVLGFGLVLDSAVGDFLCLGLLAGVWLARGLQHVQPQEMQGRLSTPLGEHRPHPVPDRATLRARFPRGQSFSAFTEACTVLLLII